MEKIETPVSRKEELTVLVIVCLGSFFHVQSMGSIQVALPSIQKEFDSSLAAIQWIGMMGAITLSSLSLCFGRGADLVGRKRFFKMGLSLYALGAGLAALSASFSQLLAFRFVMTVGLAMAAPMAGALIASVFPAQRRGLALGLLTSSIAIGRTTGPTIGGLIIFLSGWRAIFLANCLFGIVTCLLVLWGLKGKEARKLEPFDFAGALSLLVGYPSVLIAMSLGAKTSWESPQIVLWFGLAAAALAAFVWRELHTSAPLVSLSYFKNLSLSTAMLSLAMTYAVHLPLYLFGPLYMQNILQLSPFTVGLVMATLPLTTALTSPLSGRLADRMNARFVAIAGLCFLLVGIFLYASLGTDSEQLPVVGALALVGVGLGLFTPANEKLAFSTVTSGNYGVLSAMLASFASASGALGTSVAVALAEISRRKRATLDPAGFAYDQQLAFSFLLPLAAIGLLITLAEKTNRRRR